jgi:5-methylcytosine-specific restriction endonuclease McrA
MDLNPDIDLLPETNQSRRRRLLDRFQGRCVFCGVNNAQTLDHLIPKAKGGHNNDGNLVPACARCNNLKGQEDFWTWLPQQPFYDRNRAIALTEWGSPLPGKITLP